MSENTEELAQELRTIADRIEDGEYTVTQVGLSRPSRNGSDGFFELTFCTIEEFERMSKVYEDAVESVEDGEDDE